METKQETVSPIEVSEKREKDIAKPDETPAASEPIEETELEPSESERKSEKIVLPPSEPRAEDRYVVKATPKQTTVEKPDEIKEPAVDIVEESETLSTETDDEKAGEELKGEGVESNVTVEVDMVEGGNATEEEEGEEEVSSDAGNATEQEIPSFREWSQKALEEEQKKLEEEKRKKEEEKEKKKQLQQQQQKLNENKNAEKVTSVESPQETAKALKKNFASLDCGAKVVSANPESQGAGNIISPSRYN